MFDNYNHLQTKLDRTPGKNMKIAIVGSGIAGLSAANALQKVGFQPTVYERAPELREVGAGISLWSNAIRALDTIGVGDNVRQASLAISRFELRARNGHRLLIEIDASMIEKRYAIPAYTRMIHRADLITALASPLPANMLKFGHECVSIDAIAPRPKIQFANGLTDEVDLVIGGDGIRSIVRTTIHGPEALRYSGYTCWRGICPNPPGIEPGYVGEWWGRGQRIGITTIPGNRVYWFAVQNAREGQRSQNAHAHLIRSFAGWADPCVRMIESTPGSQMIHNDIYDRKPSPKWYQGSVGLIGDAAHPTTPNLGQGGCMAIEDAVVFARELARNPNPASVWKSFTEQRYARTSAIVNESWRMGRLAQKRGRITCWIRDAVIGLSARIMSPGSFLKYARYDVGPLTSSTPDHVRTVH